MTGQILPPDEPIADASTGNVMPSWYRYLVGRKRVTDALSGLAGLIIGTVTTMFPNGRELIVDAPLSGVDAGAGLTYTLGLADTTIVAGPYGTATRIPGLVVTAKGLLSAVSEIQISVSDVTGTLAVAHGGTGLALYAVGDLVQASGTTALARLAAVATGNVLLSGGVGVASAWGKVGLTTHVSGVLPVANGGTGRSSGGFTGTVSPIISITFVDGICTAAS